MTVGDYYYDHLKWLRRLGLVESELFIMMYYVKTQRLTYTNADYRYDYLYDVIDGIYGR